VVHPGTDVKYSFQKNRLVGFYDAGDEFWEGLEDGVLRLSRCAECGRWIWEPAHGAPTFRCGECGSWDLRWVEVEPEGTVYAWVRTTQPFDGVREREGDIPYVTLEAELGGPGGPRVMGVLKGSEDGLGVGARVRASIDPPSPKTKGYPSVRWTIERD
jgi:uncharacterized OB-fold protein